MKAAALIAGGAVLGGLALAAIPALSQVRAQKTSVAQSDYIENCGGCHGFDGNSAPANIPVLKDRVGYFMCTEQGREYLIRLPNVAHSRIEDPQELADLVNFVVFGIGGKSTPARAKPFAADEVARLRKRAMTNISLIDERRKMVDDIIKACGAPQDMREFYPGQSPDPKP